MAMLKFTIEMVSKLPSWVLFQLIAYGKVSLTGFKLMEIGRMACWNVLRL